MQGCSGPLRSKKEQSSRRGCPIHSITGPSNSTSCTFYSPQGQSTSRWQSCAHPCPLHAPNLSNPSPFHPLGIVCRRWAWLAVLQPKILAATDTCTTADPGIAATACVCAACSCLNSHSYKGPDQGPLPCCEGVHPDESASQEGAMQLSHAILALGCILAAVRVAHAQGGAFVPQSVCT